MDIGKMMKQAQQMQKKMLEIQAEQAVTEYEGTSGGGMVKAKMNGKNELLGLNIDASLVDPAEKEMLEDLVIAAVNDAKKKADEGAAKALSGVSGMLPPGMKMPF